MNARTMMVAAVLTATAAAAEESVVASPSLTARADGPRFRFGAAAWAGLGGYPFRAAGLVGQQISFGVQLDDRWAVLALGQAATMPTGLGSSSICAAQLLGEYTFGDHLSLATGLMVGAAHNDFNFIFTRAFRDSVTLAVPLRLTFVFGPEPRGIWRNRFFIALDAWVGAQVKQGGDPTFGVVDSPVPVGGGLSIGYQLM